MKDLVILIIDMIITVGLIIGAGVSFAFMINEGFYNLNYGVGFIYALIGDICLIAFIFMYNAWNK